MRRSPLQGWLQILWQVNEDPPLAVSSACFCCYVWSSVSAACPFLLDVQSSFLPNSAPRSQMSQRRPSLRDYYMGFYIHSCVKMSYKGSYAPSYLLCPERLTWVSLELCRPALDRHKYVRLSDLTPASTALADACEPTGSFDACSGDVATAGNRGVRMGGNPPTSYAADDCSRNDGGGQPRSVAQKAPLTPAPRSDTTASPGVPANQTYGASPFTAEPVQGIGLPDIPLMLGLPIPVTLGALTPQSQGYLREALRKYVSFVGEDLAKRIVIKLQG